MARLYTRRQALRLAAVAGLSAAGGSALASCSGQGQTEQDGTTGYSVDTVVRDYPVSLVFLADADLAYHLAGSGQGLLENCVERYAQQEGREQVSIAVEYRSSASLANMAAEGFDEGDGILATTPVMEAAQQAQTVDAGAGGTSVRNLYLFSAVTHLVRTAGSDAGLPAADTLDGSDAADGSITQLQCLDETEGGIAIADASVEPVGASANKLLAAAGFYSEQADEQDGEQADDAAGEEGGVTGVGGSYADAIASRVRVYPTQDEAMEAVASGECTYGFAFTAGLSARYPGVEDFYTPPASGNTSYQGAALARSAEPGVAKDFLQFMAMVSG